MAFDEDLAARIRSILAVRPDVTERRMFGGLAFLVGGHMAIAASREGGVLVRVDPADADALIARTNATVAVMSDRPMTGWLRVAADDLRTGRQLSRWVERSTSYAGTLPPKRVARPRTRGGSSGATPRGGR
jgi:TfoX/Sxy family transcriptional regulator of competence genes